MFVTNGDLKMKQEKIKNKALEQAEVLYDTEKEKFAFVCGVLFGAKLIKNKKLNKNKE